jgi:hypothetical protein
MNAYELANKLTEAAQLLRKQAQRIDELEEKLKQEFNYAEKLLKEREQ